MKNTIDEYDQNTFVRLGIDASKLTQNQVNTILLPDNAPEDYYQDGEITEKEAETNWFKLLVRSGLSNTDVAKAMKLVR